MTTRSTIFAVGALCAGLLMPAQASAETAITDADLNLRVGPSTSYGVIDVIPQGYPVEVLGCVDNFDWCDVAWDGLRGWVYARYLVQPGTSVYLPQWGPTIGLPIVSFSFSVYHDRHYRDRPWHRERRWSGHWRDWDDDDDDRRDHRDDDDDDRRDDRREAERDDRRDDRREAERREEQQEIRREERREAERREQRREAERLEERRDAARREERREAESRQERRPPPGQQRRIERSEESGRALQRERGPRAESPGRGRGRGGGKPEDWENRGR